MELSGKVFFITGGAQGLGKGFAEAVLDRGAKVFFCDNDAKTGAETLEELQKRSGADNVRFAVLDVTDHAKYEVVFKEAVSVFGHIDVMVNNAGIMDKSIWKKMIDINFTAVVYGTQLATEHMRKDKGGRGGRIVSTCSTTGLFIYGYVPIYSGTKHAVRSFTSSMSAQSNIDAVGIEYAALCPDVTATNLVLSLDETKINDYESLANLGDSAMSISTVIDGFIQLVTLEKMNGAILKVSDGKNQFVKMTCEDVDPPSS